MNRFHKMDRFFKSCLLASAGLVILAVTLSFTAAGRTVAQRVKEDCVRICDTSSNPLHVIVQGITRVTGDVTINNENAIATTVSGPVQVATSPRDPLHMRGVVSNSSNTFHRQDIIGISEDGFSAHKTFTVPAGKLLVIKSAEGYADMPAGPPINILNASINDPFATQIPLALIKTTANGDAFAHPLASNLVGPTGYDPQTGSPAEYRWNIGGGELHIYADPGSEITLFFERPSNEQFKGGTAILRLTISGYYIDN